MYRIGLFSKIGKVTIKTLRYYDEVGLLKLEYTDPDNGYRYYTNNQLFILHQIMALRQIGFSVNECFSLASISTFLVVKIFSTLRPFRISKKTKINFLAFNIL